MQMRVVLYGTLQGMGRTASCSFLARKVAGAGRSRYSECRVISAPPDLPDGIYLLAFERSLTCVERRGRRWLASDRPVRSLDEAPAEEPAAGRRAS